MEQSPVIKDLRDVIACGEVIEHTVCVDGEIGSVVCVCPVQPDNCDSANQNAEEGVYCHVEGHDQWICNVCDDVPVECRQGIEAEPLLDARDGGKVEVVGGNPGEPVEE